jgi:signal transduction histidine kinase/CheY-like chemotaxis protein
VAPPPLPSSSSHISIGERVFQAQVNMLREGYPGSFFISLASSFIDTLVIVWLVGDARIWGWLALRLISVLFYLRLTSLPCATIQEGWRWLRLFLWTHAYHSLFWSLLPWLFMPHHGFDVSVLITLMLILLSAGGVHGVVPIWSAVLVFLLPMMLSLMGALLLFGDDPREFWLALGPLANLVMGLHTGRQYHLVLRDSLRTRFENQALTEQLTGQMRLVQLASEEKTRFLAAASHDLRQPMHAISLFGAVLARELVGHPQHANARQLMRATGALSDSLGAMLDTSQLDAGVIVPVIAAVPLNSVFQSLNQTFIADAGLRGLQLRVRATPLWVGTDAGLLRRMLGNLIENALKYTLRGGVLVLARARGTRVWIDVVDTGIGISPEHQEQVFAEFYQVNNPGRDRSRGLGMGLSIVKRLSLLLDHPVQLCSRPGRGSRFRVVLPVAPPQPAPGAARRPAAMPAPARCARILLLDDERDIAHAMRALLDAHVIELAHAATPERARQLLDQARAADRPFDALICDLRLADGTDGLNFALSLQSSGRAAEPVLIVTGETAPGPLQRVRQAGLPVLFKPVTGPSLLQAVAGLLNQPR